jgi:trigger factor
MPTIMAEQDNSTVEVASATETETKEKLNLSVDVQVVSDCKRHVFVTIPVEDVQRYFRARYDDLMPVAEVPGFRPGKAPRKLIESKFRKSVTEQVKGSLLLDTLTQVGDEQLFSAIGEPDFDFEAVTLEENLPLQFEFDIEVRPDFEIPQWKGIELPRLVGEFSTEVIDRQANAFLRRNSDLIPANDGIQLYDVITVSVETGVADKVVARVEELELTVQPTLSFRDALVTGFSDLVLGKSIDAEVQTKVVLAGSVPNTEARDKEAVVKFRILDIKRYEDGILSDQTVAKFGDRFQDVGDVRDAIKQELERRMTHEQTQLIRQTITSQLTAAASWELPPDLLERQSRRELDRAVMELRSQGLGEDFIAAYENNLRQRGLEQTAVALREHFILERIAESEGIEDSPEDYDHEIALIAASMGDSPRRVRSKLEKTGQLDALRNQIVERKVIELIKEHASFKDRPFELPADEVEAVREYLSGHGDSEIPVAKSDFVEPVNAMGKGEHIAPRTGR